MATLCVSRRFVSRRGGEEAVEFGGLAQRSVVAFAGAGAEVDVVVADQVDVLVMGVVDAGHLGLAELDSEPLELGWFASESMTQIPGLISPHL